MNVNVEDFIVFYQVGVVVTFIICVYEYLFEKHKLKKIRNKFIELGVNESVVPIIFFLCWSFACSISWFYVGKKITRLINKEDITKDL
jgi:hypothetical protein